MNKTYFPRVSLKGNGCRSIQSDTPSEEGIFSSIRTVMLILTDHR